MWCWSFLLFFALIAAAQDSIPTDSELRSAYCVPVLQWQIRESRSRLAESIEAEKKAVTPAFRQFLVSTIKDFQQDIAENESALKRLQSYLLPRLQHLDPTALMLASNRGDADRQQLQATITRCLDQCGISLTQPTPMDDEQKECNKSCLNSDTELVTRLRACRNPSWLPF